MISDTITMLKNRLTSTNLGGLDEHNTCRIFVNPILNSVGWNLSNPDETIMGYFNKDNKENKIYYALNQNSEPLLLVEVRPLLSDLNNKKILGTILKTAENSPADYLAVSNGVNWRVYSKENNEMVLKMEWSIRAADAADKVSLLSSTSIKEGLLAEYIEKHPMEPLLHQPEEIKNRGYKISGKTHKLLNQIRLKIATSRTIKDEEISNSAIAEAVLKVFVQTALNDNFDYDEISNKAILEKRIYDCFNKKFEKSLS